LPIIIVSNPGRKPEKQYKTKEDDTMEEFITDERTGLRYELVGDYYLIAGEDEPGADPSASGDSDTCGISAALLWKSFRVSLYTVNTK
jgi:hypothetical protein